MKPLRWKSIPWVEADVLRQFGHVIMRGSRLPASSLYGPFLAGDSVERVASWMGAPVEDVEGAIRYAAHPRRAAFEAKATAMFLAYAKSPRAWWKLMKESA